MGFFSDHETLAFKGKSVVSKEKFQAKGKGVILRSKSKFGLAVLKPNSNKLNIISTENNKRLLRVQVWIH